MPHRGLLPPPGPARGLAGAQLTNALGDGAFLVTSALYFTRVVGLSAGQIGLGLTLGWAAGALAGVPLGHLADRRGPRGVAALLAVATSAAVGVFLLASSFPVFLAAAVLYGCAQSGLGAARQALLAGLVELPGAPRSGPTCSPPSTRAWQSGRRWAAPRCTWTPRSRTGRCWGWTR
ncbi:MFS transporter [Kitasatospora arboriphila]